MMIEINKIENIIAHDTWESIGDDGEMISHEIIVGQPFQEPDGEDWICPVSIENFANRIVPAYGVGPVDALMNAMTLVKSLFNKINEKQKANHGLESTSAPPAAGTPETHP